MWVLASQNQLRMQNSDDTVSQKWHKLFRFIFETDTHLLADSPQNWLWNRDLDAENLSGKWSKETGMKKAGEGHIEGEWGQQRERTFMVHLLLCPTGAWSLGELTKQLCGEVLSIIFMTMIRITLASVDFILSFECRWSSGNLRVWAVEAKQAVQLSSSSH